MKRKLHEQYRIAFGKRVRELRKAKGLTQQMLADLADIELSTINRIELGKAASSLTNLFAISVALNVHPKELLDFPVE